MSSANQKKMKGYGSQVITLVDEMVGHSNKWTFWALAAATGGLWAVTVFLWIPAWSGIILVWSTIGP